MRLLILPLLPPSRLRTVLSRIVTGIYDYTLGIIIVAGACLESLLVDPPKPEGKGPDVIMLPGITATWPVMRHFGRGLAAKGYRVHYLPQLGFSIKKWTTLAKIVEEYVRAKDLENVILVGHSKGGLVGKALLVGPEAERFNGLVALATPWQGSDLADVFSFVPIVRDMQPGYPELRQLDANQEINHEITSMALSVDQNLPSNTYLPHARNIKINEVGHNAFLAMPFIGTLLEKEVRRFR